MLKSEKRALWLPILLILALLFSIPLTMKHVYSVLKEPTGADRRAVLGVYGEIQARDGTVLIAQDGSTPFHLVSDLVGGLDGKNGNTLFYQYAAELTPTIDRFGGITKAAKAGNIMTTTLLPPQTLQRLVDAYKGGSGAVYAYDYKSGEILIALSVKPERTTADDLNRCLGEVHVPGSTMKMVTSLLAADQDFSLLSNFAATCGNGTVGFPLGEGVSCDQGPHGTLNYVAALGNSCNKAFAALATSLDLTKVKATLGTWGISTNGSIPTVELGELIRLGSSMDITSSEDGHSIWGFIGQGDTQMSMVDLAMIAGSIANGGTAATPYLVDTIVDGTDPYLLIYEAVPQQVTFTTPEAANGLFKYWKDMTNTYYRRYFRDVPANITACKTGTAQVGGEGVYNSLLLGVMKDRNVAFVILVDDFQNSVHAVEISDTLSEIIEGGI